jgi:hypothetical protein
MDNQVQNSILSCKSGIPKERIKNYEKIAIFEDLIKCSICLEILRQPSECEACGSLFCEDCINDWIRIKLSCPMKCVNFKLSKAKINTRKMLNLIILSCSNNQHCKYTAEYWNVLEHEHKCEFQKIKCPNCSFIGHFKELKGHLMTTCENMNYECGFCKLKVKRGSFEAHLDEHNKERSFSILNCSLCESSENLRKCLCKKSFCTKCILGNKNTDCISSCYVYHTGQKTTNFTYNITKYSLPKNFEAKLIYQNVDWVRTGISFTKDIVNDQTDANCPQYDIYYLLEDLVQFYTKHYGWKNCFSKSVKGLKTGDILVITLKNGELRYSVNDMDLGSVIKIDMSKKKELYLLIHTRNSKSKVEIVYITEIFS